MEDGADDAQTLRFYSEQAEVYAARGAQRTSRHLNAFLALLRPSAQILDLGCGGGADAEAMISAGFAVDPIDGVAEIAAKASARLGRTVRVVRFDALIDEEAHDAVWANASLLHVPRGALPGVLGRVWRALRPGGLHFASYKSGTQEGRDRFGRYFNYLSREDVLAAYGIGWEAVSVLEYTGGGFVGNGFAGGQGPWVAVVMRKIGSSAKLGG